MPLEALIVATFVRIGLVALTPVFKAWSSDDTLDGAIDVISSTLGKGLDVRYGEQLNRYSRPVREAIDARLRDENLGREDAALVRRQLQDVFTTYALQGNWSGRSTFDPARMVQDIQRFARNQKDFQEFERHHSTLAQLTLNLIDVQYQVLIRQPEWQVEADNEFRSAVLEDIGELRELLEDQQPYRQALRVLTLPSPQRSGDRVKSPTNVLVASNRLVPLLGHVAYRQELHDWASRTDHPDRNDGPVRVIAAPGGMGKTRLMIELCREFLARGGQAGFLDVQQVAPDKLELLVHTHKPVPYDLPTLIVVDDADRFPTEALAALVKKLADARSDGDAQPVNLVLLARTADLKEGWLSELREQVEPDVLSGLIAKPMLLGLPTDVSRQHLYDSSVRAFRTELNGIGSQAGQQSPVWQVDLQRPAFDRVLLLQIAALAEVLGTDPNSLQGETDLLGFVHRRERSYLRTMLDLHAPLHGDKEVQRAAELLVAAACLGVAIADRLELDQAIAAQLPGYEASKITRVRRVLQTCYPPVPGTSMALSGLQPDLLAEDWIDRLDGEEWVHVLWLLSEHDFEPSRLLATLVALEERTGHAQKLQDVVRAYALPLATTGNALTLATTTTTATLASLLTEALEDNPEALSLLPGIRRHTTRLRRLVARLNAREVEQLKQSHPASAELATSLNSLGVRLSDLGHLEEALQVTQRAVELYKQLAARSPDAFSPDLAGSLNNLGLRLSRLGRRAEALPAAQQAVELYSQLAARSPDVFTSDLAGSLNNLGLVLSELGHREEALPATEQGVELYKQLAAGNPDAFTPNLAASLNNLGARLSELGRREEALQAIQQAVELHNQLAAGNPDAFTPALAGSLDALGERLSDLGRREEALTATQRAVKLHEQLAAENPNAFTRDLAGSLNNLGNRLSSLGRREEALPKAQQAVELYKQLTAGNPDAFTPDLAISLNNLGERLSDLGRREEALQATQQAVELYSQLVAGNSDAFTPNLAGSLNNLGVRLSDLGRWEEALQATQRVVELYRQLAAGNPNAFTPNLAGSLSNLGVRLNSLGRREEALQAAQQAVEIYKQLAVGNPDVFMPNFAASLNNLGAMLSDLGRREEALQAAQQAVELYKQLAAGSPDAFTPVLAGGLNNLSIRLIMLNRWEEALSTLQQAVPLQEQLVARNPDAFTPGLATSLNTLGPVLRQLGHLEEALQTSKRAVELREQLVARNPAAFTSDLAKSLNNLGLVLSDLGHLQEALQTTQQAIELREHLAAGNPNAFTSDLAASLENLGLMLRNLGRWEEALQATQRALQLQERYVLLGGTTRGDKLRAYQLAQNVQRLMREIAERNGLMPDELADDIERLAREEDGPAR